MSKVFFANALTPKKSLLEKLEQLFEKARLYSVFKPDELVAIKTHFGEKGNTAFLPPIFVRRVVDKVKEKGGKPFLTDANTLYRGARSNGVDHIITAIENGFDYSVVKAPIIIADGLNGKDYIKIKIEGKHFKEVNISSAAVHADSLVVLTHFKGHSMTGFGGSLKNLGMGFGSRSGKQMMHSDILPVVEEALCNGCGKCAKWCPASAIFLKDKIKGKLAIIDLEKCYGCGECQVTCPSSAISISWESEPDVVQEKMVEYAWGVLKEKNGKVAFLNFLINISPDCDCWSYSESYIVPDIGILASFDPVAIDQASLDLVNQESWVPKTTYKDSGTSDKFKALYPTVDHLTQLKYAERIGLGSRRYDLVRIV